MVKTNQNKEFFMVRTGTYRHYKGQFYNVIGVAKHSETLEEMVIYQTLYGDYGFWVRPKAMFFERVIVNSESVPRFDLITEMPPHIAKKEEHTEEKI
jgi:hypothetical protein